MNFLRTHSRVLFFLLLLVLPLLVYAHAMHGEFHFDDKQHLLENEKIRSFSRLPQVLHHNFRPILWITYMLNYRVAGYETFTWHVVNLCMHLLNVIFVYLIVRKLFARSSYPAEAIAWGTAALFAVHPIQTESVTYISSRSELMVGNFYLTSFWAWIGFRQSVAARAKNGWFLGSLLAFVLALGTKESAITYPIILVAYEWLFCGEEKISRSERVRPMLPFFLFFVAWLVLRQNTLGALGNPDAEKVEGFLTYPFTQTRVLIRYMGLLLLPVGQNIDPDIVLSRSLFEPRVVLSVLFHISLLGASWLMRKRHPWFVFGILWFYILLAPTSSIVALRDAMAEHRTYLATMGIFWIVVVGIYWAFQGWGMMHRIFLVGVICVLALLAHQRNRVYESGLTLWGDAIRKSPQKSRPHYNLGNAYYNAGQYDKAVEFYTRSIALRPTFLSHYFNRGNTYHQLGQLDLAVADFDRVIALKPRFFKAWFNRGVILQQQGKYDEAIRSFTEVLRLEPGYWEAESALGGLYILKGDRDRARFYLHRVLAARPLIPEANVNLGVLYFEDKNYERALYHFQRAVEGDPKYFRAIFYLARTRVEMGLDPRKTKQLLDFMVTKYPELASNQQFLHLQARVAKQL